MAGAPPSYIFDVLHAAEVVTRRFEALLSGLGPVFHATQFYRRARVKSYSSIVEKLERKKIPFAKLDDIIGIRVVTLYDQQVYPALEMILRSFQIGSLLDQPLFKACDSPWEILNEAKFHCRPAQGEDPDIYRYCYEESCRRIDSAFSSDANKATALKAKLKSLEADDERYSSAHLYLGAISYQPPAVHQSESTANETQIIPMEVQIRTAAEDIWAEISHKHLYKRGDGAWSLDIERLRKELNADSGELKAIFDHLLPGKVARFRRHSEDVRALVKQFQRPASPIHRSIVASFFFAIANHIASGFLDEFSKYGRALTQLAIATERKQASEILKECFELLQTIRRKLDQRTTEYDPNQQRDRANWKACCECSALLKFEETRLRIVAARFEYAFLDDGRMAIITQDLRIYYRQFLVELDNYEMSFEQLKVRPRTVVAYWKYLVAKENGHVSASRYIEEAYRRLASDESLPYWSIYKILVPRARCHELQANIATSTELPADLNALPPMLADNGESESLTGSQYVRDDLRVAMEMALEALNETEKPDHQDRRGDILLGFQPDEAIIDLRNIIALYLRGYSVFGHNIFLEDGVDNRRIEGICHTLSKRLQSSSVPEVEKAQINSLTVTAKEIAEREKQEEQKATLQLGST